MKNVDRVIQAIYLAASNVREEMMASLVENVLYDWNEACSTSDVCAIIREQFNITPNQNEVRDSLCQLKNKGLVSEAHGMYLLLESAKVDIRRRINKNVDSERIRYANFEVILGKIGESNLTLDQRKNLWMVYNDYIHECFLQYQRDAIKLLSPYAVEDE